MGTRRAVLDEIELWMGDFDKPSAYWLNGLAGTGKTTIAQTIAERLGGRLGASFFCSRDFEDRSDIHLIFPTLAVQLARKFPEVRSVLIPLVQLDPEIVYESLSRQMEELIVRPLRESDISTVIIIDALDECEDHGHTSAILSVLGQFLSMIPKVKFFLSCRPERRIREGFCLPQMAKATEVFALHEIEPSQVDSDIRHFFRHSFAGLARGWLACGWDGLDNWPTEEELDRLCERAAGLFIYAVATVKFVNDPNNSPKHQLDFLLQSPERSDLEGEAELGADTTMNSLYASILMEAFGKTEHPQDDRKNRSALGAVVLAANPLSPSTIATLLGLPTGEVFRRLSSAQSLLILQGRDRPVRPFHKSFPDFITDPTRCTNPRFHISPPDHHSELLIGCLELMNHKLEKNMCGLPDAVINDKVVDLRERTEQFIDPGLRYACESWHKHLVDAHTAPAHTHKISLLLDQFLQKRFIFWLEILSVLGTVRDAVDALDVAANWLEPGVRRVYIFDTFPKLTHHESRNRQLSALSMTTLDSSPDSSRSSAHLLRTSITRPSPYPPELRSSGNCTNNMPIP